MPFQAIAAAGTQQAIGVVGHVHGFPRHPAAGTEVSLFPGGDSPFEAYSPEQLYALISVQWALEYRTVNLDTGEETHEYRLEGGLGTPTGTTWYLHPVVADGAVYRLAGHYARGHRDAYLPPLPGVAAPTTVPIHDYQL